MRRVKEKRLQSDPAVMAVKSFMHALRKEFPFNLLDDNFTDTPQRVVKSYREMLSGYSEDPRKILNTNFDSGRYDQMIVVKDIDFYSMCAHHMLPFFGKLAVGYLPNNGRVVGLSKIARVCQTFARRFQLQERMTSEIANAIQDVMRPNGVGVIAYDVKHLCMLMRGVKQHTSTMTTSCLLGEFRDDNAVRNEFLKLAGL